MKTYTVKEISKMLNKNPETIRRWIRNGKLKADQDSRKSGNYVTEVELQRFLGKTPKYAALAGGLAAAAMPVVGLPIAIGGLVGGLIGLLDSDIKAKDLKIDPEAVVEAVQQNIDQCSENIVKKREAIAQLEEEIKAEEQQIQTLKLTLDQVKERLITD